MLGVEPVSYTHLDVYKRQVLARYGVTLVTSEWYGFWGLMAVMLWQQAGYMMIIYISGLQSIPGDVSEAAAIDGASAWQARCV